MIPAISDKPGLVPDTVNSVNHEIGPVFSNQSIHIFRCEKKLNGIHMAQRIDFRNPLCKYRYFRPAKSIAQCLKLPVYIGFDDDISIDQSQISHTASGQRLDGP